MNERLEVDPCSVIDFCSILLEIATVDFWLNFGCLICSRFLVGFSMRKNWRIWALDFRLISDRFPIDFRIRIDRFDRLPLDFRSISARGFVTRKFRRSGDAKKSAGRADTVR